MLIYENKVRADDDGLSSKNLLPRELKVHAKTQKPQERAESLPKS